MVCINALGTYRRLTGGAVAQGTDLQTADQSSTPGTGAGRQSDPHAGPLILAVLGSVAPTVLCPLFWVSVIDYLVISVGLSKEGSMCHH